MIWGFIIISSVFGILYLKVRLCLISKQALTASNAISYLIKIVGIIVLLGTFCWGIEDAVFYDGVKTVAVITKSEPNKRFYHFKAADQTEHDGKLFLKENRLDISDFIVGKSIDIQYKPTDPSVNRLFHSVSGTLGLLILSLLLWQGGKRGCSWARDFIEKGVETDAEIVACDKSMNVVKIEYKFTHEGATILGRKNFFDRESRAGLVGDRKYAAGRKIKVFFKPDKPLASIPLLE